MGHGSSSGVVGAPGCVACAMAHAAGMHATPLQGGDVVPSVSMNSIARITGRAPHLRGHFKAKVVHAPLARMQQVKHVKRRQLRLAALQRVGREQPGAGLGA